MNLPLRADEACFVLSPREALLLRPCISPLLCSQTHRPNHGPLPWYVGVPAVSVAARTAASSLSLWSVWLQDRGSPSDVPPSHLTSSSVTRAQTAEGTEQTKGAADCCRPFTCKYRPGLVRGSILKVSTALRSLCVCIYEPVCVHVGDCRYDCV